VTLVSDSDVEGGWTAGGSGNLNADPMFADAGTGDLGLLPESPCVDQGDNGAIPGDVSVDLAGNQRIVNGAVDLGGLECQESTGSNCPADLNGDGRVDIEDIFLLLGAWGEAGGPADVNGDAVVDLDDVFFILGAWGPCP